jgi:hypothetical protein
MTATERAASSGISAQADNPLQPRQVEDRDHRERFLRAAGGHPLAEQSMQRLFVAGTKFRAGWHLAGQLISRRRGGRSNQPLLHLVHTVSVRKILCPAKRIAGLHQPHIIDSFGLRNHARTNQTVIRLAFDERTFLWQVETASGQRYAARFVIDTSGVLANPHIPDIKGAETFKGPMFHSGHWDHSVAYEGKRVGVIGSGCSGAQIVPAIARQGIPVDAVHGQGAVDSSALRPALRCRRALPAHAAGSYGTSSVCWSLSSMTSGSSLFAAIPGLRESVGS